MFYFILEFVQKNVLEILDKNSAVFIFSLGIFLFLVIYQLIKNKKKKYYCIKQHDITDCGPACIATISKQYGLKLPITKIRQIAGTDRKGTNAFGVLKAAEQLGFEGKGVKAEPKDLYSGNLPLPVIAHVVKDKTLQHYVVIQKITKKYILIADPAEGLVKYKPKDFYKIWTNVLLIITPSEDFTKGDKTQGLFTRFFHILLPHKKLLFEIFLSSLLFTIMGIGAAFYFKYLIDDILADKLKKTLYIISIGVMFLYLFKVLLGAFRRHLLLWLGQKVNTSLILNYYKHVIKLPLSFFDTRKVGEIMSRLSDSQKIISAISGATLSVMIDSIMVIAAAVVLYFQNSTLFFITLLFIPLHIIVAWSYTKPYQRVHRTEMEKHAEMRSYLVESLNGAATIKAFNGEREAELETENRFIKFIKTAFKVGIMKNSQSSLESFLSSIGTTVILMVGALQIIENNMSIGQLITFKALFGYFFGPIKRLINLQPMLQEAYVASDRLGEILDLESEKKDEHQKIKLNNLKGKIRLKDINFKYGTREKVLKNINIDIKPGETVALVGESGSGKTTLVKLIMKYYLVDEGNIQIDDYNIKDINIESLRSRIGYVPQDIFLFSGSIRENIAFGYGNIDMKKIVDAAKKAAAHEFINRMPLRYNTLVGERGATLSGGQKQRIAIARALIQKPDMLILDEATSNLDSATEKAIHKTIDEIGKDITTIIIAHRLSTIKNCDKIIVLEDGKIKEMGSHIDLIKQKGKYFKLWRDQLGTGEESKILQDVFES